MDKLHESSRRIMHPPLDLQVAADLSYKDGGATSELQVSSADEFMDSPNLFGLSVLGRDLRLCLLCIF